MSFDIKDRYLKVFNELQVCVENQDRDRIKDIIPIITRLYITDIPNVFDDFNKYDLFIPISVSESIDQLDNIGNDILISKQIFVKEKKHRALSHNDFVNALMGSIAQKPIKIGDFIRSIGYYGTHHVKPKEENTLLIRIYNEVILPNQEICYDLLFQIGRIYIYAFEIVLDAVFNSNNLFTLDHNRQPQLRAIPKPAILYNESYSQGRFDKVLNFYGLLISFDFEPTELNINKHQYVFSLGHTRIAPYAISIYLINDRLICSICVGKIFYTNQIRLKKRQNYNVSIEVYPNAYAIFKVNDSKVTIKIDGAFEFSDGKIVIGANLNGQKRGVFYSTYLIIDGIDHKGYLKELRAFSINRIHSRPGHISMV